MHGYQPHGAVRCERMGRAAIAVVPSRWPEPFGLTALEAMAHGAALVCSRRGGLPEVAGDCALYAEPDEPGAIADAVLALAHGRGAARRPGVVRPGGGRCGSTRRPRRRACGHCGGARDPRCWTAWPPGACCCARCSCCTGAWWRTC